MKGSQITARHWMRPIDERDYTALRQLAEADNHELIAPTHVFLKDGEIVGCTSIATVALVLPWFHTTQCLARDSVYFINQMENCVANILPASGSGLLCVPVVAASPFQQHIERLGYINAGPATVALKKVK
jgi:hypothetical protein